MDSPTPMLKQYHSIKDKHKDCILLFRLGDFYEMFFEDAKEASSLLDLVLTSRGKGPSGKIPMCGFPFHAAENYIARLIGFGRKVAICEQLEDPALAKGIVKRDIVRIITGGTFLDESTDKSRVLLSLCPNAKEVGVAFIDPSTGTIQANQFPLSENKLIEIISRLPAAECIFPEAYADIIKKLFQHSLIRPRNIALSDFSDWCFNPDIAQKSLCEHFAVRNLHSFGLQDKPSAVSATGALLEYLKQMNKQPLKHIDKISLYIDDDFVYISPAAHRGLELDSLIKTLDNTQTALGRRKLNFIFLHPLKSVELIEERQAAVKLLREDALTQKKLKELLKQIPDIEKNISRLSCGYTQAKDLLAIRNTLMLIPSLSETLSAFRLKNPLFTVTDIPELRSMLDKAVNEEMPLSHSEGKVIKKGFSSELDDLKNIRENGRLWLKDFQEREIKRTSINSLKVGFNQVFGYYIEVTNTHLRNVPQDYIRKQTLVNGERFITPELKSYEEKILHAEEKIISLEKQFILELQNEVLKASLLLHELCENIATIDCVFSFAVVSLFPGYSLPKVTDNDTIDIKDGRHPVVERTTESNFTPNDTFLDCAENQLLILTGPNMSGKSTYIRQAAILVIMAQAGCYLPAKSATVGIVDKVFTRIGAHDDISRGQSTFMVEMNETSDILNNLTEKSLVILDEIGRGTSTFDGLSLAWALAEHLAATKARTLFATHFHELTALSSHFPGVKNYNVAVKEWKDEIIFLHKIIPGGSDDSYGIYVAKLAGLPNKIISRARQILTRLELNNDIKDNLKGASGKEKQFTFFSA
ncbi:MAG: DNA mismatch repair protein MutS, partial [Candidatus Omnitrophica bacterium]|nr:DNA mismatch repair protein MutS [Candidatus Omnitrophota bacterium]